MKTLVALLAVLTMLLGVGCSNSAKNPAQNDVNNNGVTDTQDQNNGTTNNGVTGNDVTGEPNNNGTVGGAVENGLNDAGNAIQDGVDGIGDVLTGDNNTANNSTANNTTATNNGAAVTRNP